MMFSEDYVQSMVTARDAAALVQDVERIRVVHERFAAVPTRHWWQRLGRHGGGRQAAGRAALGAVPVRGAGAAPAAGAAQEAATTAAETGASATAGVAATTGTGAAPAAGRELAGSRR